MNAVEVLLSEVESLADERTDDILIKLINRRIAKSGKTCHKHTVLRARYIVAAIKRTKVRRSIRLAEFSRTVRPSDMERHQINTEFYLAQLRYKSEPCQCLTMIPESDRHRNAFCEECSEPYRTKSRCRNPVHMAFKQLEAGLGSTVPSEKPYYLTQTPWVGTALTVTGLKVLPTAMNEERTYE